MNWVLSEKCRGKFFPSENADDGDRGEDGVQRKSKGEGGGITSNTSRSAASRAREAGGDEVDGG